MSEAPKRIVAVLDDAGCGECFVNEGQIYEYEIPYIRADLVDGLVEALETCLMYGGMTGDDWVSNKAENALDALKEMEER